MPARRSHLSRNEKFTLLISIVSVLVGVGTLAVAWLAFQNSKDTSELKKAVGSLSKLAEETAQQNTSIKQQLDLLRQSNQEQEMQTKSLANQAISQAQQASAVTSNIEQNEKFFRLQQRPIIGFDDENKTGRPNGVTSFNERNLATWNFAYKNVGQSIAFNVRSEQMLSANGQTFSVQRRTGPVEMLPGQSAWTTAAGFIDDYDLSEAGSMVILQVVYTYNDALGKEYSSTICWSQNAYGVMYNCGRGIKRPRDKRDLAKYLEEQK